VVRYGGDVGDGSAVLHRGAKQRRFVERDPQVLDLGGPAEVAAAHRVFGVRETGLG
jgi:hypothetical protein